MYVWYQYQVPVLELKEVTDIIIYESGVPVLYDTVPRYCNL
jgi:hypothetical protein